VLPKPIVWQLALGATMSALGQKRTWRQVRTMSALPPETDINGWLRHLDFCAGRRAYFTTSRHAKRELCPGYERSSRHNLCKDTVFLDPAL